MTPWLVEQMLRDPASTSGYAFLTIEQYVSAAAMWYEEVRSTAAGCELTV